MHSKNVAEPFSSILNTFAPHVEEVKRRPAVTFWCPKCKQVSVADRDNDGNCICQRCDMLEALRDAQKRLSGAGMLGGEDDPVNAAISKAQR